MKKFLTYESPAKVMSLVGVSLFSMAFLFSVASTDASFSGTYGHISDPFAVGNVVSVIDNASQSYSNFLAVNFIEPIAKDYKIYGENIAWISSQSGLTAFLGLEGINNNPNRFAQGGTSSGEVAGAFTGSNLHKSSGLNVDDLYNVLVK